MSFQNKEKIAIFLITIVVSTLTATVVNILFFHLSSEKRELIANYINRGETINFDNNFYYKEKSDISFRWIKSNVASITIVIPYDQFLEIKFLTWSYRMNKTLKFFINEIEIDKINVTPNRSEYHSPIIYLRKGIYKIFFFIPQDCLRPFEVENLPDTRCLQLAIGDFKIIERNKLIEALHYPGFYEIEDIEGKEGRWLSNFSTVKIITLENIGLNLKSMVSSFLFERNLTIKLNGVTIFNSTIPPYWRMISFDITLTAGVNKLTFESTCDTPWLVKFSQDRRCLSILFKDMLIS